MIRVVSLEYSRSATRVNRLCISFQFPVVSTSTQVFPTVTSLENDRQVDPDQEKCWMVQFVVDSMNIFNSQQEIISTTKKSFLNNVSLLQKKWSFHSLKKDGVIGHWKYLSSDVMQDMFVDVLQCTVTLDISVYRLKGAVLLYACDGLYEYSRPMRLHKQTRYL